MSINIRNALYKFSGKNDISPTYSAGNYSLSTLVQAVLPYSSSEMTGVGQAQLVIDCNNGNLSGEDIWGGTVQTGYPKMTDVSMGALSGFSGSTTVPGGGWDNYSGSTDFPTMTFKYVAYGWAASNFDLYSECTTKIVDRANYQSVNPNALSEQSYSANGSPTNTAYGLKWENTESLLAQNDFGGTIFTAGTSTSYAVMSPTLGNTQVVPPGSGSFKVPQDATFLTNPQCVVFAFWIKPNNAYPTNDTMVWCNDGDKTSSTWNQSGYACTMTSTGKLQFRRGTGGSLTGERLFESVTAVSEGDWNMVIVRLSSTLNNRGDDRNQFWIYKPSRRGAYVWFSGFTQDGVGAGNQVGYTNTGEFLISPGFQSRYWNGQIGHFYIFWETDSSITNGRITDGVGSQMRQMAWVTDSGSDQLYTS